MKQITKMSSKNIISNSIIVIAVLFASLVSLTIELNSIAIFVAIPLAFVLSFHVYGKVNINGYFNIYIYMFIWLLITSFVAIDIGVAFREMRQMLGAFLLSYIVSVGATNERIKPWMYITFITLYLSAIYYASTHILYTGWDISGHERVNDNVLNANKLAYYTFYATVAVYLLAELVKNKFLNQPFRVLFLVMIPLSFWIALVTASRQVLIIQIPTITLLSYIRYFRRKKAYSKVVAFMIVVGVVLLAGSRVADIYNGSYLAKRSEISLADDSRPKLMANAVKVGLAHPFFGVGPDNFRLVSFDGRYSHCTYTELFANTGFFGLLLYAILIFRLLIVSLKRFRRTKDQHYLIYATFALIFIIYNFFYVFYKDMWLTAFFFLVATDSESYYNKKLVVRMGRNFE